MIQTKCEDCCFSILENNQICEANLLGKFSENEIILGENKYYTINRLCRGFRTTDWRTKYPNWKEQLKLENQFKYSIVINLYKNEQCSLEQCLNSIAEQKIQPSNIYIINYSNINIKYLYQLCEKILKCEWYIKQPQLTTKFENFIDQLIGLNKLRSYYMILNCDGLLDEKQVAKIDKNMQDMKPFLIAKGDGFIVYNKFLNYNVSIDKAEDYLKENDQDKLILWL